MADDFVQTDNILLPGAVPELEAMVVKSHRGSTVNFGDRQKSYIATFYGGLAGSTVLADLTDFCALYESTYVPGRNRDEMLVLEGRRQVMLRILDHLHLKPEQLYKLQSGQPFYLMKDE